MIAYLAELWQNGNKSPLQTLIDGLGVPAIPPGTSITPKLEYNNIDLALLDESGDALLLLEMKVDDAEGWKKLGSKDKQRFKALPPAIRQRCFKNYDNKTEYIRQTELYTLRHDMALSDAPRCAFVTLGTGEWREQFHSCGEVWKHCGLEHFVAAANKIDLPDDQLFEQWKEALNKELFLRQNCWNPNVVDVEADSGDRKGLLQLMRLGDLRRILYTQHQVGSLGYAPHVHKTGLGPDTLMTFDWPNDKQPDAYRYCEINNNGKLNFKLYFFKTGKDQAVKARQITSYQEDLAVIFPTQVEIKEGGKVGKSKTVARLDIGLKPYSLTTKEGESPESVAAKLSDILERVSPLLPVKSLTTHQ